MFNVNEVIVERVCKNAFIELISVLVILWMKY
jgi:hypothetical protein